MNRGTMNLPLDNGVIVMNGGVVTIKQTGSTQRMPVITVYPFAQPQPYFLLDDEQFTTDGVRLLFQLAMEAEGPVRVRTGYNLMAALLISPEGLVLPDLHPAVLIGTRDYRGDRRQHHTLRLDADRLGLKAGSELVFEEGLGDTIEILQIATGWPSSGPATEDNWRRG